MRYMREELQREKERADREKDRADNLDRELAAAKNQIDQMGRTATARQA